MYGAVSSFITHQIFWNILWFMPQTQLSVHCRSSPNEMLLSSTLNAGQLVSFTSVLSYGSKIILKIVCP